MKRIIYLLLLLLAGCVLPEDFNQRLMNASLIYNDTFLNRPTQPASPSYIHRTNCFNTMYGLNCVSN